MWNNVFRVKSIGINAFYGTAIKKLTIPAGTKKLGTGFINYCKKLDYITLPGNFVITNKSGTANKTRGYTYGTTLDTVTFNSALDYNACAYFDTYNFETASNDAAFKTFDGVVYTKDGTGIVRVPSGRDTLVLRDGCTTFNTYATNYYRGKESGTACNDLVRVTLPSTLSKVNNEAYPDVASGQDHSRNMDIIFDKANLEMPEIVKLKLAFNISPETLAKKLPARVAKNGDFYVGDNQYLIQGDANATSNVPNGITTICEEAYSGSNSVTKVVLPASVTAIDKRAFEFASYLTSINLDNVKSLGKAAFKGTGFTEITLPAAITAIPDDLFYGAENLSTVTCNGEVKSIGEYAFANTRINVGDFLTANTKLETIGQSAFLNVGWTNINIPANVKTIGAYAFAESNNIKFVSIKGNTAGFDVLSFGTCNNVTYQFEAGVAQAWVTPDADYYKSGKKMKFTASWDKVSDINGYEIWLAKDKALKKGVKKFTAKYNAKSFSTSITKKKAKGLAYYGIRAYKTVNGKKVYSKWNINKL